MSPVLDQLPALKIKSFCHRKAGTASFLMVQSSISFSSLTSLVILTTKYVSSLPLSQRALALHQDSIYKILPLNY